MMRSSGPRRSASACRSVSSSPALPTRHVSASSAELSSRGTAELERYKTASGLAHRNDLLTFFDYYEVDEGRRS